MLHITVTVISLRPALSLLSLGKTSGRLALHEHISALSLASSVSGEVFLG